MRRSKDTKWNRSFLREIEANKLRQRKEAPDPPINIEEIESRWNACHPANGEDDVHGLIAEVRRLNAVIVQMRDYQQGCDDPGEHEQMIHINYGPKCEEKATDNQRSAAWCHVCQRRRVQTLVCLMPIMDPETMDDNAMMGAAMYGPTFSWKCPCGGKMPAPGWGEDYQMPKASCGNCSFGDSSFTSTSGPPAMLCRKNAAVVGDTLWPIVDATDWCGEYQPNGEGGAYAPKKESMKRCSLLEGCTYWGGHKGLCDTE